MRTLPTSASSSLRLSVCGFKSIKELNDFEPKPLNILIGPNGAGKSNLIGFFRLLSWMLVSDGKLQEHIGYLGGASEVLHDGAQTTLELTANLALQTDSGLNEYRFRLFRAAGDTLIFSDEATRFSRTGTASPNRWIELGAGHREARILEHQQDSQTAKTVVNLLRRIKVYQFHNTSDNSPMRPKWAIDDAHYLKETGGNIAPFLYRLQQDYDSYYRLIVRRLRLILPFFDDFEFVDEHGYMLLRWRERSTDKVFNVSQASDGMLRTMALIALLSQPSIKLPAVIFLDEPELGLHPFAIDIVAGLIKAASLHSQIFVATQSADLLNNFEADDVVVVNRRGRASTYERLDSEALADWLAEYSLADLWDKNVLGGKPA